MECCSYGFMRVVKANQGELDVFTRWLLCLDFCLPLSLLGDKLCFIEKDLL
jgi:hypothetical protein